MDLFHIDNEIARLLAEGVDPDTGEISPEALEKLDSLRIAREWKLENVALAVKNVRAEAQAYKEEEAAFAARRKAAERQAERLSDFLSAKLNGEKLKTDRVLVTFRKTSAVSVDNSLSALAFLENQDYTDCIRYKDPEIDKAAVKRLLGAGVEVPGIAMEERLSMSVK